MKNEKVVSIIGITWLLLWTWYISHIVSQYPFQEHKGVKSLIEEVSKAPDFIKKESGLLDRTPAELEISVTREIRREWIKGVLIVFAGLLSAMFLLKKKKKRTYISAINRYYPITSEDLLFCEVLQQNVTSILGDQFS